MKNLVARALLVVLSILPLGAAAEALKDEKDKRSERNMLTEKGLQLLPASEKLQAELTENSAAYLFDHPQLAAKLAKDSGADYLVLGLALKPTYLFVYPRLKLVDLATGEPVLSGYEQLESSAQDENTTANTARRLTDRITKFIEAR